MSDAGETFGDLSESAQGRGRAELSAGSLGYGDFVEQMAGFISPKEAWETRKTFAGAVRMFWWVAGVFLVLYVGVNQGLGPRAAGAAAWGNEILRAGLFVAAAMMSRRYRVAVAAQMLLPLGMLCFLPMPVAEGPGFYGRPLVFGGVVLTVVATGWCIDASMERRGDFMDAVRGQLGYVAAGLFVVLNVVGWWWVEYRGAFPVFSILASAAAMPVVPVGGKRVSELGDVEFLYFAGWTRWRYFVSGRALAVVLGVVPFLLFTSLLDYQEQIEGCLKTEETPAIVRVGKVEGNWESYFWRQEGRFLSFDDFGEAKEGSGVERRIYLLGSTYLTPADSPDLPAECKEEAATFTLPADLDMEGLRKEMLRLNKTEMTEDGFADATKDFEAVRITSKCRLMVRSPEPSGVDFVELHFRKTGEGKGICFAEKMDLREYWRDDLERLVGVYGSPKWVCFVYGILGFVFLWRRGGDSSLARWVGIWLIGAGLVPLLTASDDTLPHLQQWFWEQSVMYRWNTLSSAGQVLMDLLYIATATAALLWAAQVSPTVCWAYLCWPTRVYAELPPVVRRLLIVGKVGAVLFVDALLVATVVSVSRLIWPGGNSEIEFSVCLLLSTVLLLVAGGVVRIFTAKDSELPRIGAWPIVAILALNLSLACYVPGPMFAMEGGWVWLTWTGTGFACVFVGVMGYLILKRDFLRVRAIAGFTMLLLLLGVPLLVHFAEESVPAFLRSGPFFGERGADMVSIMAAVLLFPIVHEKLHELLLAISEPKLRRIEHSVEHALEKIVDAEDDAARAAMVSELFEHLKVPAYLFLSRRSKGVFVVDINKLGEGAPREIDMSEGARKFLGKRRHFVDLQTVAFEWPFFFYQFELHRIRKGTGCRYMLPVSVGESLRGLLLLPDGPGEKVISHPAVTENINNVGIAAALSRRSR